jgi:HlyD family secretion protein
VDLGDRVKKGDILAELDVPEVEAELQQKKALVVQAEVGVAQTRQAVQVTEATASRTQAQIDEAKATLQLARANLERAKADKDRAMQLPPGAISRADVDERIHQVKVAEQAIQQAEARIEAARSSAAEVVAMRGKAQSDLLAAEAGVKVAQANLERVSTLLEFAKVRAPFDGVVIRRSVNPGELAGPTGQPMMPLFIVARTDMVRVVIHVPEANALAVVPGIRALVRFPALKDTKSPATVTRTARFVDRETGTMVVEIHLPNPENKLLPGMLANVELLVPAEEPGK